jgi:hypothetical protein
MKIIHDFPPNISEIVKVFKLEGFTPVFTYGDELYNPTGLPISEDLMIHEQTHEQQQKTLGKDQWWAMYLENPTFRLDQEVEAYRNQWIFLKSVLNRKGRQGALNFLSESLSSKMYGNIINKKEAKELIQNHG